MLAVALCLIWALTFIAQRTALREAPPLWIAAGRTALAALALAPALRPLVSAGVRLATVRPGTRGSRSFGRWTSHAP